MSASILQIAVIYALVTISMGSGQQGWQAAGNDGWNGTAGGDDAPNLLRLEAILDQTTTTMESGMPANVAATSISDQCRDLWNEAWNVAVAVIETAKDMVIYGYAFRSHWAWYNNYKGSIFSFSIWKDYNCRIYVSLNLGANDNNSHPNEASIIRESLLMGQLTQNNIWENVKRIVEEFENAQAMVCSGVGFDDAAPVQLGVKFCGQQFSVNQSFYSYQDYPVGNSTYRVLVIFMRFPR